jgi:lipopolysaccharide export system permease protein
MLFHSSIRNELARSFGATLVVLITVVMSMMLIRTLGLASRGSVNPQDVIMLMGYAALGHLPTILTLSLFISTTTTLGRMYRDSEMAIWFTAGRGLSSFTVPVLRFAWPVLLAIAVLALFIWPWSNQQTKILRDQYETRGDLDRVAPGQFQENSSGTRVFFIEREDGSTSLAPLAPASAASAALGAATISEQLAAGKTGRNVFISSTENNKQAITSARSGRLERIKDDQFLILNNGQRLERSLDQSQLKISEFSEYGIVVGQSKALTGETVPPKSIPTQQLLQNPSKSNLAELSWRVGLALAAVNLVLLALVVSATNPRAGRGYSLVFALLAFLIYYNMLNIGFSWISAGKVQFGQFMWTLHGGVLAMTCLLLLVRNNNWSLRNLLPQRTTA